MWTDASWLRLSRTSGVLPPGADVTVRVTAVAHREARQPAGPWRAKVGVEPSGTVLTVEGRGPRTPQTPRPRPTSATPTAAPTPAPSPTAPAPTEEPPSPTMPAEPSATTSP